MSTTFSPPLFPPVVPIPEYLLRVASTHPDREVVCYLQDGASEEEASTTSITWRQFLADVWARVDYLVEVTGLQPRTLGTERVVVGLLAESNYVFLVDLVAMFMLRWQVRTSCSSSPGVSLFRLYPRLGPPHLRPQLPRCHPPPHALHRMQRSPGRQRH